MASRNARRGNLSEQRRTTATGSTGRSTSGPFVLSSLPVLDNPTPISHSKFNGRDVAFLTMDNYNGFLYLLRKLLDSPDIDGTMLEHHGDTVEEKMDQIVIVAFVANGDAIDGIVGFVHVKGQNVFQRVGVIRLIESFLAPRSGLGSFMVEEIRSQWAEVATTEQVTDSEPFWQRMQLRSIADFHHAIDYRRPYVIIVRPADRTGRALNRNFAPLGHNCPATDLDAQDDEEVIHMYDGLLYEHEDWEEYAQRCHATMDSFNIDLGSMTYEELFNEIDHDAILLHD